MLVKSVVDIFSELGNRLEGFGSDHLSRLAMARAMEENEWFSALDICYAVEALRSQMLDKERLSQWLSCYPIAESRTPRRVAIIMAGNIPLVGFFDLMCVVASGDIPCVKSSSKDSALEEYIERQLLDIEPMLRIERYQEGAKYDAVIATGGDGANLYFRTAFEGVPSLLRGSRHSVAVLSGDEQQSDIDALADDVFTYSGLGCRNVSLVFVPKGYVLSLPTRKMCRPYHNNYLQRRALLTMQGVKFEDLGEALLVRSEGAFSNALSQINVAEYDTIADVQSWLVKHDEELQCVVSGIGSLHSRSVSFGKAQMPSLFDYADERDIMQFLLTI